MMSGAAAVLEVEYLQQLVLSTACTTAGVKSVVIVAGVSSAANS